MLLRCCVQIKDFSLTNSIIKITSSATGVGLTAAIGGVVISAISLLVHFKLVGVGTIPQMPILVSFEILIVSLEKIVYIAVFSAAVCCYKWGKPKEAPQKEVREPQRPILDNALLFEDEDENEVGVGNPFG